ncbi:hypothetical protein C8Q80DRAFT_1136552 [Daedaleopsis nitida]|nr:hypothetical protein C8Q80DRAFT_1136552 [Daedaleopsis nitida]
MISLPGECLEHCMLHMGSPSSLEDEQPFTLFSNKARRLRSLFLSQYPILPVNHFPCLTRLVIYLLPHKLDAVGFIRFLSGVPALELCRISLLEMSGRAEEIDGMHIARHYLLHLESSRATFLLHSLHLRIRSTRTGVASALCTKPDTRRTTALAPYGCKRLPYTLLKTRLGDRQSRRLRRHPQLPKRTGIGKVQRTAATCSDVARTAAELDAHCSGLRRLLQRSAADCSGLEDAY